MLKKLSFLLNIILICFIAYCIYNYFLYEEKISDLEWEVMELEEEVSDLTDERDDLFYELEEETEEKEKYQRLFNDLNDSYEELLEDKSYYYSGGSYENTNNSYSNNTSYNTGDISSIKTFYFDGGIIIKPSFNNLHLLLDTSLYDFVELMEANNYEKISNGSFISNNTDKCCYSIDKVDYSVSMIFTKSINTDIEEVMTGNNIDFTYDDGFKKYNYSINNKNYQLAYQNFPNKVILVLRRI